MTMMMFVSLRFHPKIGNKKTHKIAVQKLYANNLQVPPTHPKEDVSARVEGNNLSAEANLRKVAGFKKSHALNRTQNKSCNNYT